MSLRSALGRAQGHGAAHSGVHHWWMQRLTSIALVPLSVWLVFSLLALRFAHGGQSYDNVRAWMAQPVSVLLLTLLVLVAAWHSRLGLQVVIEDYVNDRGSRTLMLILSNFLHVLLAAAGVLAVLRVAFGVSS
jgi:succinate dehydrogenase / fumarate reductase, membrane anchor subunit